MKDRKVFLLSSNRSFALQMVRVLNQHGVSAFWVTQEEAGEAGEGRSVEGRLRERCISVEELTRGFMLQK